MWLPGTQAPPPCVFVCAHTCVHVHACIRMTDHDHAHPSFSLWNSRHEWARGCEAFLSVRVAPSAFSITPPPSSLRASETFMCFSQHRDQYRPAAAWPHSRPTWLTAGRAPDRKERKALTVGHCMPCCLWQPEFWHWPIADESRVGCGSTRQVLLQQLYW